MKLCVENLSFSYFNRKVLDRITFDLAEGSLVCVLGKNGIGKSTLFKCILGLIPYSSGAVLIDGTDIKRLPRKQLAKKMAYIPQNHLDVFSYSVFDMVLMGTSSQVGGFGAPGEKEKKKAHAAIKLMEIDYLENRVYTQLSGGEQQLVLLARAIAQGAEILIMDEPCASLDYGNQIKVMEKIKGLSDLGYLILLSTHNPEHSFLFADQVIMMDGGRVKRMGNPLAVLDEELLSEVYGIDIELFDIGSKGDKVLRPKVREWRELEHVGAV